MNNKEIVLELTKIAISNGALATTTTRQDEDGTTYPSHKNIPPENIPAKIAEIFNSIHCSVNASLQSPDESQD